MIPSSAQRNAEHDLSELLDGVPIVPKAFAEVAVAAGFDRRRMGRLVKEGHRLRFGRGVEWQRQSTMKLFAPFSV